jgi:glycosyltransferase involved in cell wall biosynthesis
MKKVLFLRQTQIEKLWPSSWPLVFTELEKLWHTIRGFEAEILHFSKMTPQIEKKILDADVVVTLLLSEPIIKALQLRNSTSKRIDFVLYDFGHFGFAGKHFAILEKLFKPHDKIIVASHSQKKLGEIIFPQGNILVCPFPLELPLKKLTPKHSKPIRFFYAGRICPEKNIELAITAFSKLKGNYRFDVFGDPDDAAYLRKIKQLITKLKLTNRITFHGHVSFTQIDTYLLENNTLFVGLSASLHEGFGMAAYHALKRNSAAILTRWGGHSDFEPMFPNQIAYVPVRWQSQLEIELNDTIRAFEEAIQIAHLKKRSQVNSINLTRLLEKIFESRAEGQWNMSAWAKYLSFKSVEAGTRAVYKEPSDPFIIPHARQYGAEICS